MKGLIIGGVAFVAVITGARMHALKKYGADSPQYKRLFIGG